MKKDLLSLYAQVGIGTDLWNKYRGLFVFLFAFLFITPFSAQELKPEEAGKPVANITVVGDAFIYSKDEAFNEQVSKNKDLQKNYKIEFIENNELKIVAKSTNKVVEEINSNKKKTENIVLASKKASKNKSVDFPKKDIHLKIKNLDDNHKFFLSSTSGNISFISPNNDSVSFKYFGVYSERNENVSLIFLHSVNYFYKNNTSKLQVFSNDFSVRPPPGLI